MSFGIVAAIGGAVIGAGATIAASKSANKAAKKQAAAVTDASEANIQLAREERAKNEQLFAHYLGDEAMARAYLDALTYGQSTYSPSVAAVPGSYGAITNQAAPITITRDQVMQQIQGTPLAQFANQDYAAREGLASDTYAGALGIGANEYGALIGVADDNQSRGYAEADLARTGRRGESEAQLAQRLAQEQASYAAWLPMSQRAEEDAINLNFSRGGVTGLIGETRRGVGETTQNAAMDRNLRYLEGVQAAYAPYYDQNWDTETNYWGTRGNLEQERAGAYTDATALRGERYQRAYDAKSNARRSNFDQYAGDKLNSYADYMAGLEGRAAKGYNARADIASGGQRYVSAVTDANNNAAQAASQAAYQRGQAQQQLYGDLANIAGTAYGAITNRKPQTTTAPYTSGSYSSKYPMAFSDRRLKEDIAFSHTDAKGNRWYRFRYFWDLPGVSHLGVMADEVPARFVHRHPSGFAMIDYGALANA